MKFTLLHPASFDLEPIAAALRSEPITVRAIRDSRELVVSGGDRTVFVLDPPSRPSFPEATLRSFVDSGGAIVALGAPGETDVPEELSPDLISAYVPQPYGTRHLLLALRAAYRHTAARAEAMRARQEAASRTKELEELTRIGMALATERDYNTLLDLILTQARQITGSDAGSLYVVETLEDESKRLRFKLSQNYSRPEIPLVEFTIPIDHSSIAGYVAATGEPLVIDDAYFIPPDVEYSFNRSVDEKYGYRTKSIMTIPMKDHKDQVIGVLQLINRKRDFHARLETPEDIEAQVIPYTRRNVELVSALAGQAAVSIENSQLYESIERLFEGFVRASVTAIEQRDPTTFGHSGRVAAMTVGLAEVVDRTSTGPYRDVKFSREDIRQIRYAGLLHDFGKVGVREQVLVKAKKLYPPDLALIKQRYAFIYRTIEKEFHRQRADYLERHGERGYREFLEQLRREQEKQLKELDDFMQLVIQSNEPTVLPEGSFEELLRYAERYYQDLEGKDQPYLTDDELRFLTIRKGSLDESERLEIESHVTHTYRFLMQIPWTKELRNIPEIAYGHHEKLDGSGYPRKVKGDQIPVQTRMMTISDIFDALTASDRPYKRAVPVPRALDIMAEEVKAGMLDPHLFELFVEAKVFERAAEEA
ncbi:MAG: HD family phosphohydrolase [Gemmatimonadales bacterium]|nr:3'3'-cGAMP-specific phosphodiesterase 3 [bacterium HR33]GIW51455.1 MAG: HD family phosphohydrolase [Gemmatimonadales bacterium]